VIHMGQSELDAKTLAAAMDAELRALPVQNTPNARSVRRKYSQMLKKGGPGDTPRTLAVCRVLAADHEDMVVKALS